MTLQIRSISIYSRSGERRDVKFHLGSLNIVTGASKTGKSALLDIVDYCWGRAECTIAEGEIRKGVSWFAVHFDNDGEGILIARKNPGPAGRASDEIYFARGVGELPESPAEFQKNITSDGLKNRLSAILGISENIHTPEPGSLRAPLEASSRHAILFCLQGQDEIANRRLLFHRQGEQFLPQAIRDSLPYFLGAVDEDHFRVVMRYQDARVRYRRLEREYFEAQALAHNASKSALSLLDEAVRAGLVEHVSAQDDAIDASSLREILRLAGAPRKVEFSVVDDPEADLTSLEEQRRSLLRQLQDVRDDIANTDRINREVSEFHAEAREQEARLVSIELIPGESDSPEQICPLCESHLHIPVPTISELTASLGNVRTQLRSARRDAPRLQEKLAGLEVKRASISDELRGVQADIAKRIADNERLRLEQYQFAEQARVAGRIAYYLENASVVESGSVLKRQLERLSAEIAELEAKLDEGAAHEKLTTALNLVGRDLTDFAKRLDLEHGNNPLRIDQKHLTVVADTEAGPLSLAQMGSGENWVGYHAAAHLSLHLMFRRRNRPVPGFLLLDQPSQAHYPPERDDGGRLDALPDEDQAAVRQLFRLLHEYCQRNHPKMQVIVADHVELLDDWFRGSITERWRDGIALVPASWLRE